MGLGHDEVGGDDAPSIIKAANASGTAMNASAFDAINNQLAFAA